MLHGHLYRSKHLKHRKAEKEENYLQGEIFELDENETKCSYVAPAKHLL
jgi:hypothetical protein